MTHKTIEQIKEKAREELQTYDNYNSTSCFKALPESELDTLIDQVWEAAQGITRGEAYLSHFSYEDWGVGDDGVLRVGDYINLNHQRGYDGYEQNLEGKIVLHDTNKLPVVLYNIDPETEDEEESGDYGELQSFFMDGWTFSRIKSLPTPLTDKKDV